MTTDSVGACGTFAEGASREAVNERDPSVPDEDKASWSPAGNCRLALMPVWKIRDSSREVLELAAGVVDARAGEEAGELQGEDDVAVEVLVEAVVAPRLVV